MFEFLLGQLPEALYFPLFLIFAKNIKTKRLQFVLSMVVEYFILINIFKYNIWFQVTYTFMSVCILKYFYKDKCQITDIFTLAIGSIILMLITGISYYIIYLFVHNLIMVAITSRIVLFGFLFAVNYKLYTLQKFYKKMWNRNDKVKKKIKSVTFRCWNLILFNIMFYVISYFINMITK